MTLGLYAIRTVSTPPVFARDAPASAPQRPRMSMIEDAERCNARLRRAWGQTGNEIGTAKSGVVNSFSGKSHNTVLHEAAVARNIKMARVFAKIMRKNGPQSIAKLVASTGLTQNVVDTVLRHMKKTGQATSNRGATSGWRLV